MKRTTLERLDIVTLFPAMFEGPLSESLLGKARERDVVKLFVHNLRDFSQDPKHHKVDDRPYGGGAGMVIQAEPVYQALRHIEKAGRSTFKKRTKPYTVFLSPQGQPLRQTMAQELSQQPWLVFVCGHYEGIDERVMRYITAEVSIGDYVLTGGELPAMVLADVVMRLVPGVVKELASIEQDSFQDGLLDTPHYTRPAVWRGQKAPEILLTGHHGKIQDWRRKQAASATKKKRPDLLKRRVL